MRCEVCSPEERRKVSKFSGVLSERGESNGCDLLTTLLGSLYA